MRKFLTTFLAISFCFASGVASAKPSFQSPIPDGMGQPMTLSALDYIKVIASASQYRVVWDKHCSLPRLPFHSVSQSNTTYDHLLQLSHQLSEKAVFTVDVRDRTISVACTDTQPEVFDYRKQ